MEQQILQEIKIFNLKMSISKRVGDNKIFSKLTQ